MLHCRWIAASGGSTNVCLQGTRKRSLPARIRRAGTSETSVAGIAEWGVNAINLKIVSDSIGIGNRKAANSSIIYQKPHSIMHRKL